MENKSILLEKYILFEAYLILLNIYAFFKMNNKFTVEN